MGFQQFLRDAAAFNKDAFWPQPEVSHERHHCICVFVCSYLYYSNTYEMHCAPNQSFPMKRIADKIKLVSTQIKCPQFGKHSLNGDKIKPLMMLMMTFILRLICQVWLGCFWVVSDRLCLMSRKLVE